MQVRKAVLPVLVLAAGVIVTTWMVRARPEVERVELTVPPPLVRVVMAREQHLRLDVRSQGSVQAGTETELVAEVPGQVVWVSSQFVNGGFFDRGEVFLKLDRRDYELSLASAVAQVAQARVQLTREEAEADVARQEWEKLGRGEAGPLVLRQPQIEEARANLAAAEAVRAKAALDLERTEIRAPFAGRVRKKLADMGQFVSRGTPLAQVYSVDYAEVRLPIPDDDLAYLNLPLSYRDRRSDRGPEVTLWADFAGKRHAWTGRIVRTEGEIDPQSRMLHLVARIDKPYDQSQEPGRPPLSVGLFVEAEIVGVDLDGVFELPRAAMRGAEQVLVVDEGERLQFRDVEVLRYGAESVVIASGLETGERVCVSPLDAPINGMLVRSQKLDVGALEVSESQAE